jgi:hypothetical protein
MAELHQVTRAEELAGKTVTAVRSGHREPYFALRFSDGSFICLAPWSDKYEHGIDVETEPLDLATLRNLRLIDGDEYQRLTDEAAAREQAAAEAAERETLARLKAKYEATEEQAP